MCAIEVFANVVFKQKSAFTTSSLRQGICDFVLLMLYLLDLALLSCMSNIKCSSSLSNAASVVLSELLVFRN